MAWDTSNPDYNAAYSKWIGSGGLSQGTFDSWYANNQSNINAPQTYSVNQLQAAQTYSPQSTTTSLPTVMTPQQQDSALISQGLVPHSMDSGYTQANGGYYGANASSNPQYMTQSATQSSGILPMLSNVFDSANSLVSKNGGSMDSPMLSSLQNRQQGYTTQAQPVNFNDIMAPIQTEIGRSQQQGQDLLSQLMANRQRQRQTLQDDYMNTINAGLTASTPGIEDRLQSLGIAQSGAYPELLAKQRANLLASNVLPGMQQFDNGTFDLENQIPMNTMNRVQGLQTGSLSRGFGLQDQASQQNFQSGLADKIANTQQLQSILGLVPALLGTGGLPALMGAQQNQSAMNSLFGGMGGSGSGSSGGFGSIGDTLGGVLRGAGGGALGSYLGGQLGGDLGAGLGGALTAYLGGGGLGGAFGAGIGGGLGGPLGGAIGGGLGSQIPNLYNWFMQPGMEYATGGDMGGAGVLANLWSNDSPFQIDPSLLGW